MKLFSRLRGRCYCAFCKAERRIYIKKHIDMTNVLGAFVLSLAMGYAYWGSPDPRILVLFFSGLMGAEMFIYIRWRSSLVCALCGFDPVIYKKSPELAASKVREYYQEREDRPEFLLSRSPLLEVKRRERQILAKRAPRSASSLAPHKSP